VYRGEEIYCSYSFVKNSTKKRVKKIKEREREKEREKWLNVTPSLLFALVD
jgi:hypothetical protein